MKKPSWIYFVSGFIFLSPFMSYFWSMRGAFNQSPFTISFAGNLLADAPFAVWALVALSSFTSFALLKVRKLTWIAALAGMGALFTSHVLIFGHIPLVIVTLSLALTITPIKEIYLSPQLRWWEEAPRFAVNLLAQDSSLDRSFTVLNISTSGALLDAGRDVSSRYPVGETFTIRLGQELELSCRVVRQEGICLGVEFTRMSFRKKRAIRMLVSQASAQVQMPAQNFQKAS